MNQKSGSKSRPAAVRAGATIHERFLKNGLRVLIAERHLDPVVAVMTWYRVGARNEAADEAGLSHFLEHMMFKGSESFGKGEVDRTTTLLGGTNNAFTTADHTAYWFELASDRWEKALEIEADRMARLTLDPGEYEAEKAVVLEELSMGKDEPWRRLMHEVQAALFPRHPYGNPVIGYADVLRRAGPEDMRAYYRRFYHPGNATLVLCGDLKPQAAMRAVKRWFGDIPAGPPYEDADRYRPAIDEPSGERRTVTRWDDPASRLCMAWPTTSLASEDDFRLDLASTLLTHGRLSRLHRRLVLEEGLAVYVSTNNDTRIDGGAFWLFAECARGIEPGRLEAAIDEELIRLANELAPAAEVKRAKAILAAAEAYEGETVSDLAESLGEYATDHEWRTALELHERRAKVTPAQIREVSARLLAPTRRVVGWSLPKEGGQA